VAHLVNVGVANQTALGAGVKLPNLGLGNLVGGVTGGGAASGKANAWCNHPGRFCQHWPHGQPSGRDLILSGMTSGLMGFCGPVGSRYSLSSLTVLYGDMSQLCHDFQHVLVGNAGDGEADIVEFRRFIVLLHDELLDAGDAFTHRFL